MTDAAAHLLVVDELVPAPLKSLPALDQLRRGTLDVVHLGLGVGDGPLRAFVAELGVLREVHAEGLIVTFSALASMASRRSMASSTTEPKSACTNAR